VSVLVYYVVQYIPPELDVDDAGVAELVVEAGLGEAAERGAAKVEVVLGHRVVVHVGDDNHLLPPGAGRVLLAANLQQGSIEDVVSKRRCSGVNNGTVTEIE
jgi:hypothetical protein